MCFSAQASFIASGLLGVIGLYSLKKAKTQEQSLAFIPFLFALQQACEGIVWITHNNPTQGSITHLATYAFCFFAFFIWPIWIPLSTLTIETNTKKKKSIWFFLFLGSMVSGSLMYCVIQHGIILEVSCSHIRYDIGLRGIYQLVLAVFYCIATIMPLLISSKRWLPLFGIFTCLSVVASCFLYKTYFISIWCFFAAILSLMIVFIL